MLEDWLNYKNIFTKFLLKSWIEIKLNENPNSIELLIMYARFMFNKF